MKKIFAVIILICFVFSIIITDYSKQNYSSADSAIVLGAAVWDGEPSPVFKARIDYAIDLYKNKKVKKLYFTGGTDDILQKTEGGVARDYAVAKEVLDQDIEIEETSQTTLQNLKNIFYKISEGESVLIVTDPLHEYRAVRMAKSLGLDAYPAPTPYTRYQSLKTKFPFLIREVYFVIIFNIFGI